ncbi:hypothetical protein GCM10010286_64600 [Streptomyces toxytricini]|nr:hypothetical protein GCM10010286_64600 [Streptomyces toxytricini]
MYDMLGRSRLRGIVLRCEQLMAETARRAALLRPGRERRLRAEIAIDLRDPRRFGYTVPIGDPRMRRLTVHLPPAWAACHPPGKNTTPSPDTKRGTLISAR